MKQIDDPLVKAYRAHMSAYCGMGYDIIETEDHGQARARIARFLRRRRALGYTVVTQTSGQSWELTEPEDSMMVPDDAGVLTLKTVKHPTVDCWDCGYPVIIGDSCDCQDNHD